MHFGTEERSYILVSLGINENKTFSKDSLALNRAQFTTVPKHDS